MATVHLDWPKGVQESIAAEIEFLGIDEGTAEMAVDIVASRLVVEIASGRIKERRQNRV